MWSGTRGVSDLRLDILSDRVEGFSEDIFHEYTMYKQLMNGFYATDISFLAGKNILRKYFTCFESELSVFFSLLLDASSFVFISFLLFSLHLL